MKKILITMISGLFLISMLVGAAEENLTEMSKQTQNPVANLISVPFEYYLYTQVGPDKQVANSLTAKPVIPFKLDDNWNLISRTIIPVETVPTGKDGTVFGLGDINLSLFLTPREGSEIIWGIGPAIQIPTNTSDYTGNGCWGLGPTAVVLKMQGAWVYGALANAVWAVTDGSASNSMLIQPFINYNLDNGWALSFAPEITDVWATQSGNGWTLPLGFGVSKTFAVDRQLCNASIAQYYNVISPDGGANYYMKAQFSLLFPGK